MKIDLFLKIISVSITSGIISTQAIQYIKENFRIVSTLLFAFLSFIIGTLFAYCFSDMTVVNSLWCGFISIIGSETIYKSMKGKFGLTSSAELQSNHGASI